VAREIEKGETGKSSKQSKTVKKKETSADKPGRKKLA